MGCGVLSGMFGRCVPLTPLNPYLVPPRGWGGVWGILRNVWWVCAADSSKPLPCTPKVVGVGCWVLSRVFGGYVPLTPLNPYLVPPRGWGGVWGILRNV